MTLDPIHVETIAKLASQIAEETDDSEQTELAQTVWDEWLDPLVVGGKRVIEPLEPQELHRVSIDDIALCERPYRVTHGLDSGTLNPTTFKNGLVLDVAHAAMASHPSTLTLHRKRTVIATVHTNNTTSKYDEEWSIYDDGHSRRKVWRAPKIRRFQEGIVHALSLYLAESEHALSHEEEVSELLFLDGPLYPKELLSWNDRDAELATLARETKPKSVLSNYIRLTERFIESDRTIAGFVKNPSARTIVQGLSKNETTVPWGDDTAFFTRLLEQSPKKQAHVHDRRKDSLTFTTWLLSRGGPDRTVSAYGDALGVERKYPLDAYTVTFFVIYDPRSDLLYKIEAPYAVTKDEDRREALTRQVLSEVAAQKGPPTPVSKADELARIRAGEKQSLKRRFESELKTAVRSSYDAERWDDMEH
ncbi:DNA double-strand break repair nuclease NurA [Halorubraceae archaeon YAN]|nr:DNA double-strand break repair nuclease NurA [Halorubraceae archaeon YAN]